MLRAKDLLFHLSEQIAACQQVAQSHALPSTIRAMALVHPHPHPAAPGSSSSTSTSAGESRRAALFSDASALTGLMSAGCGHEDTFALSLMDGPSATLAFNGQLRLLTATGAAALPVTPLVSPALGPMLELFHLLNAPHIRVRCAHSTQAVPDAIGLKLKYSIATEHRFYCQHEYLNK